MKGDISVTLPLTEYLQITKSVYQGKVCAILLALLLFINFIQLLSRGGC
jgi:hypothetical protein